MGVEDSQESVALVKLPGWKGHPGYPLYSDSHKGGSVSSSTDEGGEKSVSQNAAWKNKSEIHERGRKSSTSNLN